MGETIFRIALGELSTVRVRCKCGTVAEIGLSELSVFDRSCCPGCGNQYCPGGALGGTKMEFQGPFSAFQNIVEILGQKSTDLRLSFH